MDVAPESPLTPDVRSLIAAADALSASLYPPESNHPISSEALASAGAHFLIARIAGVAVGCGAILIAGEVAELKRMFVADTARGQGVGRRILANLVAHARTAGVRVLRLETGIDSHAALALYRSAGFVERPAFAPYAPDPLSVFMERAL